MFLRRLRSFTIAVGRRRIWGLIICLLCGNTCPPYLRAFRPVSEEFPAAAHHCTWCLTTGALLVNGCARLNLAAAGNSASHYSRSVNTAGIAPRNNNKLTAAGRADLDPMGRVCKAGAPPSAHCGTRRHGHGRYAAPTVTNTRSPRRQGKDPSAQDPLVCSKPPTAVYSNDYTVISVLLPRPIALWKQ
ncbi:unnamed protein product, partial [Iphiclides podalirius]